MGGVIMTEGPGDCSPIRKKHETLKDGRFTKMREPTRTLLQTPDGDMSV